MEKMKNNSLKRSFMVAVAITMLIVSLCSALAIFVCYRLQKYILPDSNEVWLIEQITMADGTVTEAKQRYYLDRPSPFTRLVAEGREQDETDINYMIESIESSYSMLSSQTKVEAVP